MTKISTEELERFVENKYGVVNQDCSTIARELLAARKVVEAARDVSEARGMFAVDGHKDAQWAIDWVSKPLTEYDEATQ